MKARLVDKEVDMDLTVHIKGRMSEPSKSLVEQAVAEVQTTYPQQELPNIDWEYEAITEDIFRENCRIIRIDYKDTNGFPLYVTLSYK